MEHLGLRGSGGWRGDADGSPGPGQLELPLLWGDPEDMAEVDAGDGDDAQEGRLTMNHYGDQARTALADVPAEPVQQISDPETFFTVLGEQISDEIAELTAVLEGQTPAGETFLEKIGRLNMAKLTAAGAGAAGDAAAGRGRRDGGVTGPASPAGAGPPTRRAPRQPRIGDTVAAAWRCSAPPGRPTWPRRGSWPGWRANMAALRTLRLVQAEDRPATAGEQRVLARWSGWGALPAVFDTDPPTRTRGQRRYGAARAELDRLFAPAELAAAARTTINAHYTDAAYVAAIWDALSPVWGSPAGGCWSPAAAPGIFIGLAPAGADMVGVELDPTTAAIAAAPVPDTRPCWPSRSPTPAPRRAASTPRSATSRSPTWCSPTRATTRPG